MASEEFTFSNARGESLSGVLETGEDAPKAWAIYAHCFSCGKNSLSAVRTSRALARHGYGVLRFDFAGLGGSEGSFARGFSADIGDIAAAVAAMGEAGRPVRLLIGHSFGGAASLAAAPDLPAIEGVATIGTPFAPRHVLHNLPEHVEQGGGPAEVTIAGRTLTLSGEFVDNLGSHRDQAARIAALRRPLLVMHAPEDDVVGIENAARIYRAAKHPKSFVCLDGADHLMTRREDTDYAAEIIAAWFSRYL